MRKSYKRKKFYKKRKSGFKKLNDRIKALESGKRGQELKFKDVSFNLQAGTTVSTTLLTGIAEGTGDNERIGNHIKIQSCWIKGKVYDHASLAAVNYCRIIMLYDKEGGATTPNYSEIMESTDISDFTTKEYKYRFKILWDKVIVINKQIASAVHGKYIEYFKQYKRPYNTRYETAGSAVADTAKGQFWLILLGDSATYDHTFVGRARIRFSE